MRIPSLIAALTVVLGSGCAGAQSTPASPDSELTARRDPPPRVDITADQLAFVAPRTVSLALAMEPLRTHPVGKLLGPLFGAMPGWGELVRATTADPVGDLDWIYLAGPSANDSAKDEVFARYRISDTKVDAAIDTLKQQQLSVIAVDLDVKGVTANVVSTRRGTRVLLRAQPSMIVSVPPEVAKTAALRLVRSRVQSPSKPDEALRMALRDPHASVPQVPPQIAEARVWIVPKEDGGADVFGEGDCADAAAASVAASDLRATIRNNNGFFVALATRNILGAIRIGAEGSQVRASLAATREQLEAVLGIIAATLGVDLRSSAVAPPP